MPGQAMRRISTASASGRERDMVWSRDAGKVSDYLAAGCRLVWVVTPERFAPRVLAGEHELDGEDVLPGFSVTVREIFEI